MNRKSLEELSKNLNGELHWSQAITSIYATDASSYRKIPSAVALPRNEDDIRKLIEFAGKNQTSLIPRTAGTSLAGQVVGEGIIVDVSKNFTGILEINEEEKWVRVQPGIIRDDLNKKLAPYGLFFAPETSTSNRAMIGGMIGNNSCGSNSIVYGSTREHLLEIKALLSDGSPVIFSSMNNKEFHAKCDQEDDCLETQLYQMIREELSDENLRASIKQEFPKPSIHRRNTGYAIDNLSETLPFNEGGEQFNFCRLLAGSEGTLAFITEAKLKLESLPSKHRLLLGIHFGSVYESLEANLIALKHKPSASELMDHYILDCTRDNSKQEKNRFFVQGDPKAILVVELRGKDEEEVMSTAQTLISELKAANLGYHYPIIEDKDANKVWDLRKAGLGLLSNIKGDAKPVPVVEDTAVDVEDLPAYVKEFDELMSQHGLYCVHYAHAGSGELHLRPIINLKEKSGQELFRTVLKEVSALVKKYNGSLSGEHGDGRLRGEFISFMIGEENYALLERIKQTWDPGNVFNPGKITNTPPMNTALRYKPDQKTREIKTVLDFEKNDGFLRAVEQCNGSGDCRKTVLSGGTMCPSYMVTKDEKDTTRARANILREVLTHSTRSNPFNSPEIMEVMDLCISCKGCKTECPSGVDVTKLKQEFLHQYYQSQGIPFKTRMIAKMDSIYKFGSHLPGLFNFILRNGLISSLTKRMMGFASERKLPRVNQKTFIKWIRNHKQDLVKQKGELYLFIDEFTNLMDGEVGKDTVLLLNRLGYKVHWIDNAPSGRAYLSKGLLTKAKDLARTNVKVFSNLITEEKPLVGIEPSAILSFRDEYIDLLRDELKDKAVTLAASTYTLEEFLVREMKKGNVTSDQFTQEEKEIQFHGHCFQKALSSTTDTNTILSLPENYKVSEIPSGCCGMAGSFGYEEEHYAISMQIGELTLFPEVREKAENSTLIAAGFSCRHQILDGTGKTALHPSKILLNALK